MKWTCRCLSIALGILVCLHPFTLQAHPGWGIQINSKDEILFTDVNHLTIWKLAPDGKLSALVTDSWTHSIQLDAKGNLYYGREEYRGDVGPYNSFRVLTAEGIEKEIIAPVLNKEWYFGDNAVMGPKGIVYFLSRSGIMKRDRDGQMTLLAEKRNDAMATLILGPADTLFVTEGNAVCTVSLDGVKTRLTKDLISKEHDDPLFGKGEFNHVLGFDVAKNGDIYVAYVGNRRLLKIDAPGMKSEIYHAKAPWSPVGVTFHKGTLYVLETGYTDEGGHLGPRVRKRLSNDRFETLVTIE